MRCPFPGMDPYLERREIWPDFHDSLITYLRETLQPLLRPRYVALTQDRLFVVESDRPIHPDVSVVETGRDASASTALSASADADTAVVIEMYREEIRQPLIHIIEPAAGNRIVTGIEVLSPDNKTPGAGRESYLRKCEELWHARANLVEIGLLRGGAATIRVPPHRLEAMDPFRYIVSVSRWFPSQYELYPIQLRQKLPRFAVPLTNGDADVVVDLQSVFERCWEAGPYPELLNYGQPLADLSEEDATWCEKVSQEVTQRQG